MKQLTLRTTLTDTPLPYTTLFRAYRDAAQPVRRRHTREDEEFPGEHADGAAGPAQRSSAELPVPGLRGCELYVGPGAPSQWRHGGRRLTARAITKYVIGSRRNSGRGVPCCGL